MEILVVGAGTMGHGIAEVCAICGYDVTLCDVNEEALRNAVNRIAWSLEKLKLDKQILSRIKTTTDLEGAAKRADFVIEAVVENTEIKRNVFRVLDENCRNDVILATNTSTIPISEIASATKREDRVVGLHFFNPPTLIRLVEVVRGERTSDETVSKTVKFAESIGMDYVLVNKDVPGFIVNRINVRIFYEALKLLEDGYKPEEIDAVKYRLGLPMGVLEVADFSGIDVAYNVMRELAGRGMDVEPPEIIKEMVESGKLGMKSGAGFYEYSGFYARAKIEKSYKVNPLWILAPGINEAAWLISNGVASKEDIDKAMVKGMNYPKGILEMADDYGLDNVLKVLEMQKARRGYRVEEIIRRMVEEGKLGKKTGEGFYKWKYEKIELGPITYEKRHDYALITMNRERKLNALNDEMWLNLKKAFELAKNDEVRVVVVTGKGRAFCAGDDVSVMKSWKDLMEGKEFFEKVASPLIEELMEFDKPVVSLVNGIAFGGGLELNLLFDVVVASDLARFSVPEGLIGAFPPIASTLGLMFLGRRFAKYCLTGEEFDAEEAKEIGLVDEIVPHEQLELAGVEFVNKIARLSPTALRAMKRSMNCVKDIMRQALRTAMYELVELVPTEEFRDGMAAFLEKRRPRWVK